MLEQAPTVAGFSEKAAKASFAVAIQELEAKPCLAKANKAWRVSRQINPRSRSAAIILSAFSLGPLERVVSMTRSK